jgi:RNA polymerase sigma-70 factor (ECF subfamily)
MAPQPMTPDARDMDTVASAARQGDDEALTLLVQTYHDRVYRFGMRVCRDHFDADDSVQEAFTKLAQRPEVLKSQSVLGWLFSVVLNTCKRMMRPFMRERRVLGERVDEDEVDVPTHLDPEQALERFQLVTRVHAAIATLERPYREVLIMRDIEGRSGEETSAALGLELATMKTRLHRARTQLRAALELAKDAYTDSSTKN